MWSKHTKHLVLWRWSRVLSAELRKHCWIGRGMLAWKVIVSEWDESVMARIWRAVFILTAQPQIGRDPSRDELLMLSCPGLRLWFWCSGQGKCEKNNLHVYWSSERKNVQLRDIESTSECSHERLWLIFPLLLQCYQTLGHGSRLWYVWLKPSNQT